MTVTFVQWQVEFRPYTLTPVDRYLFVSVSLDSDICSMTGQWCDVAALHSDGFNERIHCGTPLIWFDSFFGRPADCKVAENLYFLEPVGIPYLRLLELFQGGDRVMRAHQCV